MCSRRSWLPAPQAFPLKSGLRARLRLPDLAVGERAPQEMFSFEHQGRRRGPGPCLVVPGAGANRNPKMEPVPCTVWLRLCGKSAQVLKKEQGEDGLGCTQPQGRREEWLDPA